MNEELKCNAFTNLFAQLRAGDAAHEFAEAIQAAVAATNETQAKSKIVFTLTIAPAARGAYLLQDDLDVKLPKLPTAPSIYYGDKDNNLVRENPAQLSMDLKTVPSPTPQLPVPETVNE